MNRPRQPSSAADSRLANGGQPPRPGNERRSFPRAAPGATVGVNVLWLWGTHPVLAALANPQRALRRLLLTAEALHSHRAEIEELGRTRSLPQIETLVRADLETLLPPGAVHQGIALATEPLAPPSIGQLLIEAGQRERAAVVVLDQVTDPHNVGAVLRSAAAFGAVGLVVPDRHAPEETGALAKAAAGALERLPLVRVTNLVRALQELKSGGFWVAGLAGDAPQTLAGAGLSGRIALVLGSEGEGLRRLTRENCDYMVRLPQSDLVESLNVSNAAAVALYELVRK
jgi:23S rRNA (guanosine2251-2'-O)-methyltransferase